MLPQSSAVSFFLCQGVALKVVDSLSKVLLLLCRSSLLKLKDFLVRMDQAVDDGGKMVPCEQLLCKP